MMSCPTCGDTGAVKHGELNFNIKCPGCEHSFFDFPAELPASDHDGTEDEIWNTSQQQIYVRNLKRFVSFVDWDKQLLEFGISYDDFTCAKCYVADKCRSAFDSYNTNGDCLEEK